MDLGTLTIKDVLVKKFGDDKAAQILSELQEGIDKKLPADELRLRAKAIVEKGGPAVGAAISDISAVGATSAASAVAI
jgi:hypothetical protein